MVIKSNWVENVTVTTSFCYCFLLLLLHTMQVCMYYLCTITFVPQSIKPNDPSNQIVMPFDLWHHFVVTSIMYYSSKLFPDSKIAASFLFFLSSYKLSILRCFLPLMAQLTFQEKQYIYVGRPLKQFLDDTITQTLLK